MEDNGIVVTKNEYGLLLEIYKASEAMFSWSGVDNYEHTKAYNKLQSLVENYKHETM